SGSAAPSPSQRQPKGGHNARLGVPLARVVGNRLTHVLARVVATAILSVGIVGPLHDAAVASDSIGPVDAPLPVRPDPSVDQATQPGPKGFTDQAARVSFDPPLGWIREPSDALNPQS